MDSVIPILPHLVWAVATLVCVFRFLGRRADEDRLNSFWVACDQLRTEVRAQETVIKELAGHTKKLEHRLNQLEVIPARKQVF